MNLHHEEYRVVECEVRALEILGEGLWTRSLPLSWSSIYNEGRRIYGRVIIVGVCEHNESESESGGSIAQLYKVLIYVWI
jgi:hypothetical protein